MDDESAVAQSGGLVRRFFLQLDGAQRHHRRNRMFVNKLGLAVPAQQSWRFCCFSLMGFPILLLRRTLAAA
jgi:hypothetical protein